MDDFGNDFATAQLISATGAELGALEVEGDVDVFRVDLVEGQSIKVQVAGRTDGVSTTDALRLSRVILQTQETHPFFGTFPGPVLDAEESTEEFDFSILNFTAPSTDTYFISVSGDDFTPDDGIQQAIGTYFLTVELETFGVDDHGDSAALATQIDGTSQVTGDIGFQDDFFNYDDEDVFAIDLEAGERIVIDARGKLFDTTFGTLENLSLSLSFEDLENVVASDESFDASGVFTDAVPAVIDHTAEVSGTYLITTSGISDFVPGEFNDIGAYQLDIDVSTNTIPVGDPSYFEGALDVAGETDFYEVTVTGGDILYVNARGTDSADPLDAISVTITTEDGQRIRSETAENGDPAAFFFFLSGTFLVQVTGVEDGGDQTGSYEIAFGYGNGFQPDLAVEDVEVEVDALGGMFTVSGFITNSGETGSSETDLRLHLTERDTFSSLDPVLFEETGILIPDPFAGRESRTFRIPESMESGTYRIGASIDPNRRVFEQNERNNTAISAEFTYTRPVFTLDDTAGITQLRGTNRDEIFRLDDDDARDLIRDFNPQRDLIDVTALGATSLDDLSILNLRRGDGQISWIEIRDQTGEVETLLRVSSEFPLVNAILNEGDFIFADTPRPPAAVERVDESDGFDQLRGSAPAELFVLRNDGLRDQIREFDAQRDQISVEALGATSLDDLTITELKRKDGSTSWLQIEDSSGDAEVILRFNPSTAALTADSLNADHFVFADAPPPLQVVADTAGLDRQTGTNAAELFTYGKDNLRDSLKAFDPSQDRLDLTAFDAASFDELEITNLLRRDGSTSWVQISDADGAAELIVRFDNPLETDSAALTAALFDLA